MTYDPAAALLRAQDARAALDSALDEVDAAIEALTPAPPTPKPVFGISTGSGPDTVTNMTATQRTSYWARCIALGVTSVRVDDWGSQVNLDVIASARAAGLDVLVTFNRRDLGGTVYANFCARRAVLLAQKGVTAFELLNEPNLPREGLPIVPPATYGSTATAATAALLAAVPSADVCAGSLSNYGVYPQESASGVNPVLYLERMLAAVGGAWLVRPNVALGYHPYGVNAAGDLSNPSGWLQAAGLVDRLLRYSASGVQPRIWITENGAQTKGAGWSGGVDEAVAARFEVAAVAAFRAAPWAVRGRYYKLTLDDWPSKAAVYDGHLGLYDTTGRAKLSRDAFKATIAG